MKLTTGCVLDPRCRTPHSRADLKKTNSVAISTVPCVALPTPRLHLGVAVPHAPAPCAPQRRGGTHAPPPLPPPALAALVGNGSKYSTRTLSCALGRPGSARCRRAPRPPSVSDMHRARRDSCTWVACVLRCSITCMRGGTGAPSSFASKTRTRFARGGGLVM